MELKKNEKANLENKKSLFLQIGLILALIICIVALEWTSGQKRDSIFDGMTEEAIEEEQMPLKRPRRKEIPPRKWPDSHRPL